MAENEYTKFLAFKGVVEDLFGSDAWYALKESNHIPTWRGYCSKVLKSLDLAIEDTVSVCDESWKAQVKRILWHGIGSLGKAKEIDEMIGIVAASVLEVSFLQLGLMPRRKGSDSKVSLRKGAWKLDAFRSVQYVQSEAQKEQLFLSEQQRRIGFQRQSDLQAEYRRSGSNDKYAVWCAERENA